MCLKENDMKTNENECEHGDEVEHVLIEIERENGPFTVAPLHFAMHRMDGNSGLRDWHSSWVSRSQLARCTARGCCAVFFMTPIGLSFWNL